MTRYTKLDGRKPKHLPATNRFDAVDESSSPEPDAAPAPSEEAVAGHKRKREEATTAAPADEAAGEASTSAPAVAAEAEADPVKLHKRAKLLRLKAKKAKDPAKRAELEQRARDTERMANTANGVKGKAGMGDKRVAKSAARKEESKETNPWKVMEAERRGKTDVKRDARREARAAERNATTRCFACRGLGHAARDCPAGLNAESRVLGAGDELQEGKQQYVGKETVGICFRCGSTEHTLARCKRPVPRVGSDMPFATCFICAEKGHLASKCSKNQGRGVYPHGGCCKLCNSVEHLAKDCPLSIRAAPSSASALSLAAMSGGMVGEGVGDRQAGADEDDFHMLARKRAEVEREDAGERALKKRRGKAGDVPAVAASAPKKVVSF